MNKLGKGLGGKSGKLSKALVAKSLGVKGKNPLTQEDMHENLATS